MKIGVDTCQPRRIHKLHTKLLWTKLTFAKLTPESAVVSQLTEPGCLGCCGLIARLGDAMRYLRYLQPPVVFRIFDSDAGQVRSLTSPRFQASRSRN